VIREAFKTALKEAMLAKDNRRVATVRLILAGLKDKDIAARGEGRPDGIPDAEILQLLAKMVKQRAESAEIYAANARPELAQQEREEIAIIEGFMPRQMSADEARQAVQAAISDLGAASIKDMGRVMAALKERHAGSMDFAKAGAIVKELLQASA